VSDPVPLVLDLRITHDRFGHNSDPTLNGNLHYPTDIDRSLNESTTDKIRKYHSDYNNSISFMSVIVNTTGYIVKLYSFYSCRLIGKLTTFFSASGVHLVQYSSELFHFRLTVFSSQLKVKVDNTLAKPASLRVHLNLDGTPITSRTHTHPSHSHHRETDLFFSNFRSSPSGIHQWTIPLPSWDSYHFKNTYSPITLANFSSINLVFIFRCSSSPTNPVCGRRVDSSTLFFSLSSHRHSNIGLIFNSRFIHS
jgi:hypothetical protein